MALLIVKLVLHRPSLILHLFPTHIQFLSNLIFVSHNLFSKSSTIFKTSPSCLVILRSCFTWTIPQRCQPMTTGGAAPFVHISKLSENEQKYRHNGSICICIWYQTLSITRNVSVGRNNLLSQSEDWQKKIPMSQATYVLFWLRVTSDGWPLFIVYSMYTVCSIQPQT